MDQKRLQFKDDKEIQAALEALLFVYGEPMPIKKMVQITGADQDLVAELLVRMQEEMNARGRGLRLVVTTDAAQMVTAPFYASLISEIVQEEFSETLSPASLEALSIIAYRGPLSRSEIDYIRGVNSTFILRALLMRGMVERHEHPDRPNAYVYQISFDMMRMLGLERMKDLPEYEKYHELNLERTEAKPLGGSEATGTGEVSAPPIEESTSGDLAVI